MTPQKFRNLAMSLHGTSEHCSGDRTDFCVHGFVFASLFPKGKWAVIKLTPTLQAELVKDESNVFEACKGAWGVNGATIVLLEGVEESSVLRALASAWQKNAPNSSTEL